MPIQSISCPACGGQFSDVEGPTHDYMLSSAGCWAAYGKILAREYEDRHLFTQAHRLTVDAYALQHLGDLNDRRSQQSVWIHFIGLELGLIREMEQQKIPRIMDKILCNPIPDLPQRPAHFSTTHEHVLRSGVDEHVERTKAWALCAYEGWIGLKSLADQALARI